MTGFDSGKTPRFDDTYTVYDFAESQLGQELYAAIRAGYGFPGVSNAGDLTDMQRAFLHAADTVRQKNFLEGIAELFSE